MHLASNDSLHSRHDKAGKVITANVTEDVKDAKGNVGIPAGAVVTFTVVTLEPAKSKSAKDGKLTLSGAGRERQREEHPVAANVGSVEHTLQGQGVTAGGAARVGGRCCRRSHRRQDHRREDRRHHRRYRWWSGGHGRRGRRPPIGTWWWRRVPRS